MGQGSTPLPRPQESQPSALALACNLRNQLPIMYLRPRVESLAGATVLPPLTPGVHLVPGFYPGRAGTACWLLPGLLRAPPPRLAGGVATPSHHLKWCRLDSECGRRRPERGALRYGCRHRRQVLAVAATAARSWLSRAVSGAWAQPATVLGPMEMRRTRPPAAQRCCAFLQRGYTEIDTVLESSDGQPGSTLGGLGLGPGGGDCIGNAPASHAPTAVRNDPLVPLLGRGHPLATPSSSDPVHA